MFLLSWWTSALRLCYKLYFLYDQRYIEQAAAYWPAPHESPDGYILDGVGCKNKEAKGLHRWQKKNPHVTNPSDRQLDPYLPKKGSVTESRNIKKEEEKKVTILGRAKVYEL